MGRLQQVVAEGGEAEGSNRLGQESLPEVPDAGGEWPEALNLEEATESSEPVGAETQPVAAETQEDAGDRQHAAMPLCGPIYGSEAAATGSCLPAAPEQHAVEMGSALGRIPGVPVESSPLRVPTARGVRLEFAIPSQAGERRGRHIEQGSEVSHGGGMRFPALSIQSVDWSDAIERERQSWAGIPPLAGLIQIAGPQTLRFEPRQKTPMALPEHPAVNPVRAYKPGLARGAGVPGMAGAIRGLGKWRTRFGSEGRLVPQWESGLEEVSLAPDWKPRYPVFYTTKPWDGDGLEQIFGLGPGTGVLSESEGNDPPSPQEIDGTLIGNSVLAVVSAAHSGAGSGSGTGPSSGDGSGSSTGSGAGRDQVAALLGTRSGLGGATASHAGTGSGSASKGGSLTGRPSNAFGGAVAGAGGGLGSGTGSGWAGGQIPGPDRNGGLGTGGAEESGGVVSLESVAALVKAARQSDRSRTPLRDIEVKLMQTPAAPRGAVAGRWRGMCEGQARDLPNWGPLWTKVPYEVPTQGLAFEQRELLPEATVTPAPKIVGPKRPVALKPAWPALEVAAQQEWNHEWLSPAAGPVALRVAGDLECKLRSSVRVPTHEPSPRRAGGAAGLQAVANLPEPWVEIQDSGIVPAQTLPKPSIRIPDKPWLPVRRASGPPQPPRRLEMRSLERPGSRWVLLRGSEEAATFRLGLDHLRLSEPAPPPQAAEWGPVGLHNNMPNKQASGLPGSRGFVHGESSLQRTVAEPMLEPAICLFGSARGEQ